MMITASALLRIDEERAVKAVAEYLHHLCARHSARGVLAGLSGGVDSAVLVALATRSLGESSVHAMYLYDWDSERGQGSNAGQVAHWLGIELETESIEPGRREGGIYTSWGMRITRLSPFINRFMYRLYHLMAGETPFVSSLRAGGGKVGDRRPRGSVLRFVNRYAEELFYARHRYRREVLESKARARNWLLLGGANRSEWEVGWFVKDGVDDLPYQPLIGLYKTQVRQLARYLGVPGEIRQQAPSPDMMRGISDEYALGMSYSKIDIGLDYLAGGLSKGVVRAAGVTEEGLRRVREMKELSRWKRRRISEPFPVDGGRSGGLRIGE
ncbi:MAG: NAD(+) synthase [Candidatus Eisenbacteria sp.]|nr:NAD(+) synthase [Candidatus Eisenbacteria bacterium]